MKRKVLGRTELEVSTLSLGTWQFGGAWGKEFSQKEVSQMVAVARDAGVNMIDTAECYGNHVAEALIGEAIKGQRDQWVLATKFGHDYETGVRAGPAALRGLPIPSKTRSRDRENPATCGPGPTGPSGRDGIRPRERGGWRCGSPYPAGRG